MRSSIPPARLLVLVGLAAAATGSLALAGDARAEDILLLYGGYSDDNAYDRTIEQAVVQYAKDTIVDTLDAYDLERRFGDLLVVEGEAEIVRECEGGQPPDLKLLEQELERLKRNLDYEGMVYAYSVAIDELACAGNRLSRQEAASLYVKRGMAQFKAGEIDRARDDFASAFVIDPSHPWDKRHTPKAMGDFEEVRDSVAGEYSYALYVADDGPSGSGIHLDGLAARPGTPIRLLPGEHLIAWSGPDSHHAGILQVWSGATLIGPQGLFDFLFRDPAGQEEQRLRDAVLAEIAYLEDVDRVVLLDPVFTRGSLAKRGRFSSPGRIALAGGYSRYAYFDYGNFNADLWLRIYNVLHAELKVQFDMTSGRRTGGEVAEGEASTSDFYMMPSVQVGLGGHVTHGNFQPGGGMAVRLHFTGPSLILMPTLVFHGGLDIRPWEPPIVLRFCVLWGMILTSGDNDSAGRTLEWSDGGRGIFNFSFGFGFIL